MELLVGLAIVSYVAIALNNYKLRKELKKKIDFEYEQYLLWRNTKN